MADDDRFCDSPFWNSTVAWYGDRPDLTSCFQDTILICLPCALLWCLSPFNVYHVFKTRDSSLPISKLFRSKLICYTVLIVSALVSLILQAADHVSEGHSTVKSDVTASLVLSISVAWTGVVTTTERRKSVGTSGILFLFWLVMAIGQTFIFYSAIVNQVYADKQVQLTLSVFKFGSSLCLFVLHCFAEKSSVVSSTTRSKCPETEGSYLSLLTFWWMNRLMIRGFKTPLTEELVDDLHPDQMTNSVVPPFLRNWKRTERQLGVKLSSRRRKKTKPRHTRSFTNHAYLSVHLKDHTTHVQTNEGSSLDVSNDSSLDETDHEDERTKSELIKTMEERARRDGEGFRRTKVHVSLARMLWKTFGWQLMVKQLWQVFHNAFVLTNPILIGLLIDFISDPSAPTWRGYFYSLLIFCSTVLQSVCAKQVLHQSGCTAMRVRTAVQSAVYRKALRLDVSSRLESTVGEMVNLLSVDADHLEWSFTFFFQLWSGPVQLLLCMVLLYVVLGPAMLAGVLLLMLMLPCNMLIFRNRQKCQEIIMALKDSRLKILNEVLNGIKIIKMYAWEPSFASKILKVREKELAILFQFAVSDVVLHFSWTVAVYLICLAIFITYIYTNEEHYLQPKTAFMTLTLLEVVRVAINTAPETLNEVMKAMVSTRRLDQFLNQEELRKDSVVRRALYSGNGDHALSIDQASFSWGLELDPALNDINLHVTQGSLVVVVGPVGAGKSSLLSALLGEMYKLSGRVCTLGSIAYVPQQAWIQHDSIRANILFGRDMHQELYDRCLYACDLGRDLDILPGADLTEIGERGVNLSGGQKQRVSLARAVYSEADVYLLDDPLSAVDVHVGMHIFRHVLGDSGLLAGKTRVLVTHGVQWLPHVDLIVMMKEGRVEEVGTYNELLSHDGPFAQHLRKCLTKDEESEDESDEEVQGIKHQILQRLKSVTEDDTTNTSMIADPPADTDPDALHPTTPTYNRLNSGELSPSGTTNKTSQHRLVSESSRHPGRPSEEDRQEDRVRRRKREVKQNIAEKDINPDALHRTTPTYSRLNSGELSPSGTTNKTSQHRLVSESSRPSKEDRQEDRVRRRKKEVEQNIAEKKHILVDEETVQTEGVKPRVLVDYIRGVGVVYFIIITASLALYHVAFVVSDIFLSQWTDDERLANFTALPANSSMRMDVNEHYLSLYGGFGLLQTVLFLTFSILINRRMIVLAKRTHDNLLSSILHAPMVFFDTTPLGRIVTCLSEDINSLDEDIQHSFSGTLQSTCLVLSSLFIVIYSMPWLLIAVVPVVVLYISVQRFYIPTSRQLTRLESKNSAPVYSYFSESVMGAGVIRAYDAKQRFISRFEHRVDENTKFRFYSHCANRWLGVWLDVLGALIVLVASLAAVYLRHTVSLGLVGLTITYALSITENLYFFVESIGEFESGIVSLERLLEMTTIEQEAPWEIASCRPRVTWPEQGAIQVNNIGIRYRQGLDLVLRGVSFSIKRGEKIGIVGRTGAGKSTLTLALFRLLELAKGKVCIDDLDISRIGLHDLRSRLTVLPQDPVIFSGTIRSNLDPFSKFSNHELWSALQHAHFKSFVSEMPLGLDYECGEGGENLSVGQQQLLCLGRTLLHRATILVLDEATAAVDMETDDLIQETLRTQFADCTVLTIAHRLHTIMDYDKILVMENGQVAAFDSPQKLLQQPDNIFYRMAASAGLLNSQQQQQHHQ